MSAEIVNVTRQVVLQKIEERVKNPRTAYDTAFANPSLRQKLAVRVLNNVSPYYAFYADKDRKATSTSKVAIPSEEERKIEAMIHENLVQILQEENALQYFQPSQSASQPVASPAEPSHWFG